MQQILAVARFQLQGACPNLHAEPMLANVERLLEQSIGKSRSLSHELSPAVLEYSDLVTALRWLAQYKAEQFGLYVELETSAEQLSVNTPIKMFLFRAVQELLFNIAKHAMVKSARVVLSSSEDAIKITVSDHGQGFDPLILDSLAVRGGLGLLSLRERANYLGGSLVIESAPLQGSRFTLTVPLSFSRDCLPQRSNGA